MSCVIVLPRDHTHNIHSAVEGMLRHTCTDSSVNSIIQTIRNFNSISHL